MKEKIEKLIVELNQTLANLKLQQQVMSVKGTKLYEYLRGRIKQVSYDISDMNKILNE